MACSILLGSICLLSIPPQAQAGFFSSLLGDQALAQTNQPVSILRVDNSQTMDLLQANVSPVSVIKTPEINKTSSLVAQNSNKADDPIDPNAKINIVSDSAILPATGPLGVASDTDIKDTFSEDQTSVYVVRSGDSISQIADMFGVSVNTILLANDMKKGEKLVPGDVLLILPISGLEHTVTKGQTLKSIAKLYKADINDIIFYNGLTDDTQLAVGDKIMIPGGDMIDEGGDKPASNLNSSVARDQNYYITHPIQNLIGYFINPLPTGHKTQGLHGPGNRGIDIGAPVGTPIYASASGTVLVIKTGCKVGQTRCGGGYGNMAVIQHPNGTKTLYGHMSKLGTHTGASVSQGEVIGYVGDTGRSTGPHVHFEVFNAKNPGSDWSWANQ